MGLPVDFTFKWHMMCDSVEVVKDPFKGTENIETIIRTRSTFRHPGARNDVVFFVARAPKMRTYDPGDDGRAIDLRMTTICILGQVVKYSHIETMRRVLYMLNDMTS